MTSRTATLIGFCAILLWSTLALFTAMSGRVPPFQLVAMTFIIGGLLQSIPSQLLPDDADLADFQSALWLIPVVVVVGAVAALVLPEKKTVAASA